MPQRSGSPARTVRQTIATAVGWLGFASYAGWGLAMFLAPTRRGVVNDLLFFPFYLAAGLASLWAGRRHRAVPRLATGWRLIGAAWLCSSLGALIWLACRFAPSPLLDQSAWLIYNLYYPITLAGMWQLFALPACPQVRRRLAVEAVIVTVAMAVLAWYFAFRFHRWTVASPGLLKAVLTLGAGELLIVSGACAILHQPTPIANRRSMVLFGLGVFSAALADFAYEQNRLLSTAWSGPTGDVLLALAATLVFSAAIASAPASEGSEDLPGVNVGLALLPYVAVAIVAGLLVYESTRANLGSGPIAGLIIGGAILLVLVIVRVWVAHREFVREASARASQDARFRSLVEHSTDGVVIVDSAGAIQWSSPAFARMVDSRQDELTGRGLIEFVPAVHHDRVRAWLAAPAERSLTALQIGRGGQWRDIDAIATDLRGDRTVGGIVLNIRDVTERTRLETELRHAQKMEVVGRLSSSVAHDFNNLLTVVLGNLQLARGADDPERQTSLGEAEGAARRGVTLARQLLSFGRPTIPNPRAGDLNRLVRGLEGTLHTVMPRSMVIRVETTNTPLPVTVDEVQLEQMLLNLTINARDAMAKQGTVRIRLSRRDEPTGPFAEVSVEDDGAGMSPDILARASEPFFTTKPVGLGTGLGLATVRRIATELGGRIEIESAVGRGTRVSILLPLTDLPVLPANLPPLTPSSPTGKGHVLLVDDEPAVRRVLARQLRAAGYRVIEAADAAEALTHLAAADGGLDLMLTDIVMPGMRGDELARRVLRDFPKTRVLCMSGTPAESGPIGAPWSATQVLAKPVEIEQVTARIAEALGSGLRP